jgi:hypothetical protein
MQELSFPGNTSAFHSPDTHLQAAPLSLGVSAELMRRLMENAMASKAISTGILWQNSSEDQGASA